MIVIYPAAWFHFLINQSIGAVLIHFWRISWKHQIWVQELVSSSYSDISSNQLSTVDFSCDVQWLSRSELSFGHIEWKHIIQDSWSYVVESSIHLFTCCFPHVCFTTIDTDINLKLMHGITIIDSQYTALRTTFCWTWRLFLRFCMVSSKIEF